MLMNAAPAFFLGCKQIRPVSQMRSAKVPLVPPTSRHGASSSVKFKGSLRAERSGGVCRYLASRHLAEWTNDSN
jgi:hypothetical protein